MKDAAIAIQITNSDSKPLTFCINSSLVMEVYIVNTSFLNSILEVDLRRFREEYLNVPSHEVILSYTGCCKVQYIGNYEPGIAYSGSMAVFAYRQPYEPVVCKF